MNELKPCPFCGEAKDIEVTMINDGYGDDVVRCNWCGAYGPPASTPSKAKEAWNDRPTKYLSFVEELVWNPKYSDYIAGRIEVIGDGLYADEEIRFFTKNSEEFALFRAKYDFKDVTKKELEYVRDEVNKKYNKVEEK